MKKILITIGVMWFLMLPCAFSSQAYLDRFLAYREWNQNLPEAAAATTPFLSFIREDTPLANKLREKWLYHLAEKKDWPAYHRYYRDSEDTSLQCYAEIAKHHMGEKKEALKQAKSLWLVGESQPAACDELFSLLLHSEDFDESLITRRIILALEKRNLQLARYLLKQYKEPRLQDAKTLFIIYRDPTKIAHLETGELHDDFYLYGLKRMVARNMDQAIQYWRHVKTKKLLSESQQQSFLAHLALYKAIRGHDDTYEWFRKVEPANYNDSLLDWQIRFALKRQNWAQVQQLIAHFGVKNELCWQYWLARSLEAQGQKSKAKALYQELAKTRHYYGFLASLKLNQSFYFDNENPVIDMSLLKVYQPFLEHIKTQYHSNKKLEASRLLNDFISELPKNEASALTYWVAYELEWPGKSVYLSNVYEALNNQLTLRFPLSYRETVNNFARNYTIRPEFIYAIIRQESAFRPDVTSRAGARGLMQIMPGTAKMVAKKENISYQNQQQLFSLRKNINIGVAYLQLLSKRFNRHPLLIAAAYNAGPEQVNYWRKNHPPKAVDVWIETLPWHETRNYLKNVIAFYAVYQYRLQKKPDLREFMAPI